MRDEVPICQKVLVIKTLPTGLVESTLNCAIRFVFVKGEVAVRSGQLAADCENCELKREVERGISVSRNVLAPFEIQSWRYAYTR